VFLGNQPPNPPQVEALQACFANNGYAVRKTAYETIQDAPAGALYKPDIVITNSTVRTNKPDWEQVAMSLEVKTHDKDSTATVFKKRLKPSEDLDYTQLEKEESAQHYNYVSSQFQGRPQRGLFSISICGRFIRFYYWAPSRVVFTLALDYTEMQNVQTIIAFFRAWEAADPHIRGEDVAPWNVSSDWEKYTFKAVKVPIHHHARWKCIVEYVRCLLGDDHAPIPKRPKHWSPGSSNQFLLFNLARTQMLMWIFPRQEILMPTLSWKTRTVFSILRLFIMSTQISARCLCRSEFLSTCLETQLIYVSSHIRCRAPLDCVLAAPGAT
jgi:hypothetical protein